jgi:hypothetical protein
MILFTILGEELASQQIPPPPPVTVFETIILLAIVGDESLQKIPPPFRAGVPL